MVCNECRAFAEDGTTVLDTECGECNGCTCDGPICFLHMEEDI